jgi:beta-glucosidase
VPSKVGALLVAWYPGTEGGNALADVLSGDVSPSGKLPVSFPKTTGQVPLTYNHLPTGRPAMANDHFTSKYVDTPIGPLYPFGFGLSYTDFKYATPVLLTKRVTPDDTLQVAVDVTNTGDKAGKEVVQLYTHQQVASRSRPVRELKAFQKIALAPGETKTVVLKVPAENLAYFDEDGSRVLEAGTFDYWVGGSSDATDGGTFAVTDDKRVMAGK